jgi:hypothetical protein
VIGSVSKRGTSSEWAAEFRRNILAHFEAFRGAPLFLLVTPSRLYLWKDAPTDLVDESPPVPPDYEVDGKLLFSRISYGPAGSWRRSAVRRSSSS